jgi:predicted amidohydrolase YtcJ
MTSSWKSDSLETHLHHVRRHSAMRGKKWFLISVSLVIVAILASASAVWASQTKWDMYPDTIMTNGNVITVDDNFSTAQAVAIKDGKIVGVGSNKDVMKLKGKATEILDLKGATVLPGIRDSHIHLSGFGLSRPPLVLDVGYPSVKSIADVAAMIAARVPDVEPGSWIRGRGWDRGFLEEIKSDPNAWPTRGDIDPASPNNPVYLTDFSGHVAWVNTAALVAAGIDPLNPPADPANGTIQRDADGHATGILFERAAGLVSKFIPPTTEAQQREGILTGMHELNSLGITTATEPGLPASMIDMYNDLYNEGLFTVRMNIMVSGGSSLAAVNNVLQYVGTHTGFGNEWLRISGFKLLADGIPPSKTAFMYPGVYKTDVTPENPNGTPSDFTAQLLIDGATDEARKAELISMIKAINARGFQIGVHTTGDRGIDEVVEGFIAALDEHPWDARHYVIHCDYTRPGTAALMAQHNILCNVQSTIKWTIGNLMIGIVGADEAAYQWPLRTMIDAGVVVTNSSDASVTYPDWRQGVESAILREDKATGQVSGADQCITVEEAIRTYTINGAYQDHLEDVSGSIEVGKFADFTVIGGNILTVDPHAISDIPILLTIIGGEAVYNPADGFLDLN